MKDFFKKNWFKLSILIMVLIATLSVAYYYLFFLPKTIYEQQKINTDLLIKSQLDAQEVQSQSQKQISQIEYNKQTEIYRKECITENDKLVQDFTDFLNTCIGRGNNSEDFCLNSDAGKAFSTSINVPISTCINYKRNSLK